jgi:RNA polymerase sigma factor (sigma-70 family)
MWEQTERSPALAAPGSSNFVRLIASTSSETSGATDENFQGLSDKEANNLCAQYSDLAKSIAWDYRGKGIDQNELQSAADTGLVLASRRCGPDQVFSFGAYARYWIKGEITALFKKQVRNPLSKADSIEDWNEQQKNECDESAPALSLDLSKLTPKERTIIEARSGEQTLQAVGNELGLSAERVRQIETRAAKKLRKGNIALACIRDLTRRRGYRKPPRKLLPFRSVTYPCRAYSKAEIEAYERGEL